MWHMLFRCFRGQSSLFSKTQWYQWLNTPVPPPLVKGHLIIERLKQLAVSESFVAKNFLIAWKEYQKNLYSQLLRESNLLFRPFKYRSGQII